MNVISCERPHNELARVYPFVMSATTVGKLHFVHMLVEAQRGAPPAK